MPKHNDPESSRKRVQENLKSDAIKSVKDSSLHVKAPVPGRNRSIGS